MSNFDRPGRDPDNRMSTSGTPRNSNSWIAGAVIAVLAIIAIGYMFGGRMMGTTGMTDHRASAPDIVQPTASPSSTPKP